MSDRPVVVNSANSGNEVVQAVTGLKASTTYYWKVVAKDSVGEMSTDVWSFDTK